MPLSGMSKEVRNEELPSTPPKRRKLKHPRTAKACAFCRRRKVRCSGTLPCDYCRNEGVKCDFEDDLIRPTNQVPGSIGQSENPPGASSLLQSTLEQQLSPRPSRRPSGDLPQAFAEGQLIGPTSGVSLLYHLQSKAEEGEPLPPGSLTTHGDISQTVDLAVDAFRMPATDEVNGLLERYFQFAMPTYRFLHRPTLEKWASLLTSGDEAVARTTSRSACVFLACAQALLYSIHGDQYLGGGDSDLRRSRQYYARAKSLLDQEPGPADLASVQARLAMCLYLLSTFRITECRFCFGFTNTVLTSLGLHRRASSPDRLKLVEVESRRRTFWCAYVLDGYLSVMLGRPRLFRDEDIDQPYPRNFDDQDLMSSESAEQLPLHGNLEAFVGHIEMAKLMAYNNDLLYPLRSLSEEEILTRTAEMIGLIQSWRNSLPDFLKPREKTLAGQRTFERQNTVLKLAHAHLSILATRRCLLIDFSRIGRPAQIFDQRARDCIRECVMHIATIINAAHDLIDRGGLYQAFWYTQYISLVAISTFYVLLIQDSRISLPDQSFQAVAPEVNLQMLFEKAKPCQRRMAALSPEGSQSHRHHRLLDSLRARCEKDMMRRYGLSQHSTAGAANYASGHQATPPANLVQSTATLPARDHQQLFPETALASSNQHHPSMNGLSMFPLPQSTLSEDDETFQNLLGWEDLDILGFPTNAVFDEGFFMS